MSDHIEAPTDAQLGYIASLCEDRGVTPPEAVHSKTEASEIIDAIRARTYVPGRYKPLPYDPAWPDDSGEVDERARYEAMFPDYSETPF